MIILREDQLKTVAKSVAILKRYNLLYLAAQVRCGKTIMSMTIAKELGFKRILFLTVKKAISSIKSDYLKLGHTFNKITITNYQQVGNLIQEYDLIICDEATFLSAFPKPGVYCQKVKELAGKTPVILMSGSPTPESPSQIFHQFSVCYYSPFSIYRNFYAWAKDYVKHYDVRDGSGKVIKRQVKQKYLHRLQLNDYSEGLEEKIKEVTKHYMVTLSQEEAGFTSHVEEEILWVDIDKRLYQLMDVLKKDRIYKLKNGGHIVCDTPAKMQSAFHQISSGTIISDEEKRQTLDESKAWFIKSKFAGKKIAIFYNFIEEGNILRKVFPLSTDNPEIFNENANITFVCQFVSGRMGVNLSTADALVAYNIAFSATTYFQFRARMQSQTRTIASKLYWIFSKNGIEKYVYKAVSKKLDYTLNYFRKDFGLR